MNGVNEYRIIRELQGGQFGRIFLVTRLEREYILKHIALNRDDSEIIIREVF